MKKPMISRRMGEAWRLISLLPDQKVQAVITDPMYDAELYMDELERVCSGNIIAFCAPENMFFVPDELAYWIKPSSTKNSAQHLSRFVEFILIRRRGGVFNSGLHWSNYTGVYEDRLLEKSVHPFQKPISLMERLIAIYTKPGDLILDPFMGSGATLRAAQRLGRGALGFEHNPDYYHLTSWVEMET